MLQNYPLIIPRPNYSGSGEMIRGFIAQRHGTFSKPVKFLAQITNTFDTSRNKQR